MRCAESMQCGRQGLGCTGDAPLLDGIVGDLTGLWPHLYTRTNVRITGEVQ